MEAQTPQPTLNQNSGAWIFFTMTAFVMAVVMMVAGIWVLPVTLWIKGYLAMGLFFTVASTITLSKTMRDEHEARKIVNRIQEVKTEKMLRDFDMSR